jgi:hypothetical protein
MDITPPGDDKGVRRLKLENEKGEVKETSAVAPYPRIESSEERHEPRLPLRLERRKHQRRGSERRRTDRRTGYDTRSHEERRKRLRRAADHHAQQRNEEDASSTGDQPLRHIDEEV